MGELPNITMPRPIQFIESVPAAIEKSMIAETRDLMGCVNAFTVVINGREYEPDSIVFHSFAGSLQPDGLYHGVYRFTAPVGDEAAADLTILE